MKLVLVKLLDFSFYIVIWNLTLVRFSNTNLECSPPGSDHSKNFKQDGNIQTRSPPQTFLPHKFLQLYPKVDPNTSQINQNMKLISSACTISLSSYLHIGISRRIKKSNLCVEREMQNQCMDDIMRLPSMNCWIKISQEALKEKQYSSQIIRVLQVNCSLSSSNLFTFTVIFSTVID